MSHTVLCRHTVLASYMSPSGASPGIMNTPVAATSIRPIPRVAAKAANECPGGLPTIQTTWSRAETTWSRVNVQEAYQQSRPRGHAQRPRGHAQRPRGHAQRPRVHAQRPRGHAQLICTSVLDTADGCNGTAFTTRPPVWPACACQIRQWSGGHLN